MGNSKKTFLMFVGDNSDGFPGAFISVYAISEDGKINCLISSFQNSAPLLLSDQNSKIRNIRNDNFPLKVSITESFHETFSSKEKWLLSLSLLYSINSNSPIKIKPKEIEEKKENKSILSETSND